jgi:regulator of CtrA degradation
MANRDIDTSNTIILTERKIFSDRFKPLYNNGMMLVEEAAAYLDGEGRQEAKNLSRLSATLYAAESMRLTTRLMQIASWLLLQRAANSGEMSKAQILEEKSKVILDTPSATSHSELWSSLPEKFISIVERSLRMQDLVRRMDTEVYPRPNTKAPTAPLRNPVIDQIDLLQAAFPQSYRLS